MLSISAIVSSLSLMCAAQSDAAPASPPTVDPEVLELRARIAQLEAKVGDLQAKSEEEWLSETRAQEIRAVVQDTLADADVRASLLQDAAVAGWDQGFFLRSADGNFLLRISGQMQFRFVWNHQYNSPTDDNLYGFEMRRAKLLFVGNVFDPSWQYSLELAANRSTGDVLLGDNAWVQKNLGGGVTIKGGQFKPMYLREESVSSRSVLGIERSQVNSQFTAGTAQGVQIAYESDSWRIFGAFIDGFATGNTAWQTQDNEFAATSRAELLAFGDWASVRDDDSWRGSTPALLFGFGAAYELEEYGTGTLTPPPATFNSAEVNNLGLTADATWKAGGFSLAGALIYRSLWTAAGDPGAFSYQQWGAVARGGFFVAEDVELYGMYEWGSLDIPGAADLSTITLGFNKFWNKHNLKWQSDIGYGINPVASQWAQSSAGWRADAPGQNGQVVIRTQFQLLF